MNNIVIFYSDDDIKIMARLRADLEALGLNVWTREEIYPGDMSGEQTEQAINQAESILIILTPNATKSTQIRRKIIYSQEHNKRIIPLLAHKDIKNSTFIELAGLQHIDFNDYVGGVSKLADILTKSPQSILSDKRVILEPIISPRITSDSAPQFKEIEAPWITDKDRINFEDMIHEIVENPTVFFVGAGLSKRAGYPLLDELLAHLEECIRRIPGNEDYKSEFSERGLELERAYEIKQILGENFYSEIVQRFTDRDIWGDLRDYVDIQGYLYNIPSIPFFVTTNYDICLELAGDIPKELWFPPLDSKLKNAEDKIIYHIHGYIDPDNPEESAEKIILAKTIMTRYII